MRTLIAILVLIALCMCAYWAASHYVVRTDEGVVVLRKRFLTFSDFYVDTRDWGFAEYRENPRLREAFAEQGYGDLLRDTAADEIEAGVDEALERARKLRERVAKRMDEFRRPAPDKPGHKPEAEQEN